MDKRSQVLRTPTNGHHEDGYTPRLSGDALAARRAMLREQAERLRREEDPAP